MFIDLIFFAIKHIINLVDTNYREKVVTFIIYIICVIICCMVLFSLWCMLKVSKMADESLYREEKK